MKKQELIKLGSSNVKGNSVYLQLYFDFFKLEHGYTPHPPCCGNMSDWNKFISSNNNNNKYIEIMSKSFEIKDKQKIHSFVKERRTQRCYGHNMTEEFAIEYLTIGTEEEIEIRKKDFKKLPILETEVDAENKLSFKDLKELYPQFAEAKSKKEILLLIEKLEETEK